MRNLIGAFMEDFDAPQLCSICGGVRPNAKNQRGIACECTCSQCSDGREME